jgi:hypothetical protein
LFPLSVVRCLFFERAERGDERRGGGEGKAGGGNLPLTAFRVQIYNSNQPGEISLL